MRSYIEANRFIVGLTNRESCEIVKGQTIFDRRNPLNMEAKVEVAPMSAIEPGYEQLYSIGSPECQKRLKTVRCIAWFFANTDVVIYVPPEVPNYAFIAAEYIERDAVRTILQGEEREALLSTLPEGGIVLKFDDVG